ncbi:angiopoietin-related protein 2-like [Anopheles ziemanni]|uniref:angiopoietin-related protein 2-like n=1 Tax=Anopheles coustani TaxID=139045 RepID=UPI002657F67D|nr:angiopoietin-related protein 2-like [Anopheles coustani]XP_058178509.1 angiopoietin-related protein 2-like [Anopheles ziemanni]
MEAIVRAMIDFRKEILDNLQMSLEYHTEQLDEIYVHMGRKMEDQESRMKNEINEMKKTLGEMSSELLPRSCDQVKSNTTETVYVSPYGNIKKPFLVLCNFDNNFNLGGGWTVFQRRMDGSVDFYQNWTMYKNGFGNNNGELWLGLEKLHIMTRSEQHELLVLLEDFDGNSTYALYENFKVGSEAEKYKLSVGQYSGTAGDALTLSNGMKFSTLDQVYGLNIAEDSCAVKYKGAWWFKSCSHSHLNGPYYQKGNHVDKFGVYWQGFPREKYSLKSTTMMFRTRT